MANLNDYISVDCVIFGFDFEQLNVLIVERTLIDEDGNTVFSDHTLTGNHIYDDETLDQAATRILYDLTGLHDIFLEQFKTFAHPNRLKAVNDQEWLQSNGRDPSKRIITVGYFALLSKPDVTLEWKGRNVKWMPVHEIGQLGFDHNQILKEALKALQNTIMQKPVGFELLPEKFTLTQLQKVYEILLDTELDKRNFRKKVSRMKYLVPLNEKQKNVSHKPAQLYMFSRDVYEKTKKDQFDFSV